MTFPQAHQAELIAFAELAGISAPPGVFRVVLELLALQVSPEDVYILLKQICPRSVNKYGPNDDGPGPDTRSVD